MAAAEEPVARVEALATQILMLEGMMTLINNRVETMDIRVETVETSYVEMDGRVRVVELGRPTATPWGSASSRPNDGYIPPKMLMPKTFSDKPEDWRAWKEDVLDWIEAINPGVKDVLEAISKWDEWEEMDLVDLLREKPERVKNDKARLWGTSSESQMVNLARW